MKSKSTSVVTQTHSEDTPIKKKNSSCSRAGSIYLLLGVVLTLRLATLGTIPLVDPSEGRYATIALEMNKSGDYVTPMIWIHGKLVPFWGKPPLSFWMRSLSFDLFGVNEFAARLPSFLSGVALLLLIYWIIKRYRSKREAELALLVTSTCGGFFIISGVVLQEMTLTLFASGAFLFYYAFIHEKTPSVKKWMSLGVFVFLALGFMTKGPVALVIFGVPVFLWHLLNRRWKILGDHAWVTGGALFLIITAPWFIIAERKTPGFLHYFFICENFYRFFKKHYGDLYGSGHRYPYGSAIVFFLIMAAPWSLVMLALIWKNTREKTEALKTRLKVIWNFTNFRKTLLNGEIDFFLLGFVGLLLFWSAARQMALYYMIQVIPAFSIWLASYISRSEISKKSILALAWLAVSFYMVAQIVIPITFPEKKSTKNIISEVMRIRNELKNSGKIVFARKTPYSALFYVKSLVVHHPKESVDDSFTHHKVSGEDNNRNLYVVRTRHVKDIKPMLRDRIKELYSSPGWKIYKYDFQLKKGNDDD